MHGTYCFWDKNSEMCVADIHMALNKTNFYGNAGVILCKWICVMKRCKDTLGKNGLGLMWEQIAVIEICIFSWFRHLEGENSQYSYVNSINNCKLAVSCTANKHQHFSIWIPLWISVTPEIHFKNLFIHSNIYLWVRIFSMLIRNGS